MATVAVVGEVVADAVLPPGGIVDGAAQLTVHPGGGPANTAVALARLGTRARFAGRLSGGALGALCRAKLEASGVDLAASETAAQPATLAIARLDATGAATYEFYVEGTSDWGWTDRSLAPVIDGPFGDEVPAPVAVHSGSLALALHPSAPVIERLLHRAHHPGRHRRRRRLIPRWAPALPRGCRTPRRAPRITDHRRAATRGRLRVTGISGHLLPGRSQPSMGHRTELHVRI